MVAVDVALAFDVVIAAEDALLEAAAFVQFGGTRFHLFLGHVAGTAGAAELQYQGHRDDRGALRAVGRTLREVADDARLHLAVAVKVELAFDLIAKLIEIMPVPWGEEVAGRAHQLEEEIARSAALASHQLAVDELPLAVLKLSDDFLDLVALDDLHRVSPGLALLKARLRQNSWINNDASVA